MADKEHFDILKKGREYWNGWMLDNWKDLPKIKGYSDRPLRNTKIESLSLTVADLSGIDLREFKKFDGYNFKRVRLNNCNLRQVLFVNCKFKKANLQSADLREASFENCTFELSNLIDTQLNNCTFLNCTLSGANLGNTVLFGATFNKTKLDNCNLMWSKIIETNFQSSELNKCRVFGASIWNVKIEDTIQKEFLITKRDELEVTVDNLEIAQFLYLMITNTKISKIIETLSSRIILILGRFTNKRKLVLENIKNTLRKLGYVPVIFDFQKPDNTDYIEPILLIAQLARFIIADFTDSKVVLEELPKIVDNTTTVVIPIIESGQREPSTLYNLRINRLSILDTYNYDKEETLLKDISEKLIPEAEVKMIELQKRREKYTT